jgi:hypothetical protein
MYSECSIRADKCGFQIASGIKGARNDGEEEKSHLSRYSSLGCSFRDVLLNNRRNAYAGFYLY